MPEIITAGVDGGLVGGDDPAELAELVAGLLADDALYSGMAARAEDVVAYYSWERAAADVLAAVSSATRVG